MPLDTDSDRLTRRSYYEATAPHPVLGAALDGDGVTDVAILGGGLAGLSAARELARRGREVTVLEARHVGWGASGRNGGQALAGFACDMEVLEAQLGPELARQAWDVSLAAVDAMRETVRREQIECDWHDGALTLATTPRKARATMAWAERHIRRYGAPFRPIQAREVGAWIDSPCFHGGVFDPHGAHLHPLRYTQGLAAAAVREGARIHEHTPVLAIKQGTQVELKTPQGRVLANQVLLAGNVYQQGLAPMLDARIMPVGTYIACTEPLDKPLADSLIPSRAAVCDTNFVLDYFRTTGDNRMLYGGRVSYSTWAPADLDDSLRRRMVHTFPQLRSARIQYAWGGFVDITMNRAPDFGRLPPSGEGPANIYYLQGFSGHGLALTGMAGQLVAQAMCGDAGRFDIFARLRHRPFPGGRRLRTPALVLGMAWYRLRDMLG
jgi:gamma-glutamylputrescine oxidase